MRRGKCGYLIRGRNIQDLLEKGVDISLESSVAICVLIWAGSNHSGSDLCPSVC